MQCAAGTVIAVANRPYRGVQVSRQFRCAGARYLSVSLNRNLSYEIDNSQPIRDELKLQEAVCLVNMAVGCKQHHRKLQSKTVGCTADVCIIGNVVADVFFRAHQVKLHRSLLNVCMRSLQPDTRWRLCWKN